MTKITSLLRHLGTTTTTHLPKLSGKPPLLLRAQSLSTTTTTSPSARHLARFSDSTLTILPLPLLNPSHPITLPLPFTAHHHTSDIIGSTNGVLCISDHPNFVALCNPTTGSHRHLLSNSPRLPDSHWVDFGVGYDPESHDFKLLRIDQTNGPTSGTTPTEVSLFSLKENKWVKLHVGFPLFLAHPKAHGKELNNSLHWIATLTPPQRYDLETTMQLPLHSDKTNYHYVIVAFDIRSHECRMMKMPDFGSVGGERKEFPVPWVVVLDGCLCVQVEHGPVGRRCVELWMMREYGNAGSWVRLFGFGYEEARPERFERVRAVVMSEDRREVLMEQGEHYFWYDMDKGVCRDVVLLGGGVPFRFAWCGGHPCDFGSVVYQDKEVFLSR